MFSFKNGAESDVDLDQLLNCFNEFNNNFISRVISFFEMMAFSDVKTILNLPDMDAKGFPYAISKIAKEVTGETLSNYGVKLLLASNVVISGESVRGKGRCVVQTLVAPYNQDDLMKRMNVIWGRGVNASDKRAEALKKKLFGDAGDMLELRNHVIRVIAGIGEEYLKKRFLTKSLSFQECHERKDNLGCSVKSFIFVREKEEARFVLDVTVNCLSPGCSNDIIFQETDCELEYNDSDKEYTIKFTIDREKLSGHADKEKIKLNKEYSSKSNGRETSKNLAMPSATLITKEEREKGAYYNLAFERD